MALFDHPRISERYFFPRDEFPAGYVDVKANGETLRCYHHVKEEGLPTVIFFHGNGEVVDDYIPDWAELFASLGANAFFAEYRGYGGSTGTPKLAAMLDDVAFLASATKTPPDKLIAFGRSIGSIYAIELASRIGCAGLILESGIASVLERIVLRARPDELGTTMADLEAEDRRLFDHHQKLQKYKGKLLVMHALKDSLVSISHAHSNFESATALDKRLVEFPRGDHNSVFWDNRESYVKELGDFIRSLT